MKKKRTRKQPDPKSYPRKRKTGPHDLVTYTAKPASTTAKARVLAACTAILAAQPKLRLPKMELNRLLIKGDKGVADYKGYICWLLKDGCLALASEARRKPGDEA